MSIFNNNNLDPFGTNSLFADINNTNQQINSMNLPSFAKEEEEKKRKKAEQIMKLRNLADTLNMVNAQKSGNAQAAAMYSNRRRQRQLDEEARLRKAEQQAEFNRQYNLLSEDHKRIVDQQKVGIKLPTATNRKYEKAADGFFRYIDDGSKVFGGIEIPKKGFEITTGDVLGAQKDERKTFEATNKGVKNFQQLLDAAKAADGAASYALMIKFIKQLDDSVVREGEVATFGGFQGALTNLKNQISKTSGEGFTPDVKANMINLAAQTANRLVNDYGIYRAGKEASYGAIGFDPNMIFAGLDFNLGDLDLSRQYTPNDFEFIELE